MEKVLLYGFSNEVISISMLLYFDEEGQLIFDGYDYGKRVKEFWGDSDFEYTYTIVPAEVEKLYPLLQVRPGDKNALLKAMEKKFYGEKAYHVLGDFMQEHGIAFDSFTYS